MSETRTTSELVRSRVNAFGELHLDKVFTELLIEMIQIEESQLTAAKKCIADMRAEIDLICGVKEP